MAQLHLEAGNLIESILTLQPFWISSQKVSATFCAWKDFPFQRETHPPRVNPSSNMATEVTLYFLKRFAELVQIYNSQMKNIQYITFMAFCVIFFFWPQQKRNSYLPEGCIFVPNAFVCIPKYKVSQFFWAWSSAWILHQIPDKTHAAIWYWGNY